MKKKSKTIYNFFSDYTKEQVDEVLSKLSDTDKNLLMLKYGNDLEHPDSSLALSKKQRASFYSNLIPKMKKMLANPEYKVRKRKEKLDELVLSEATTLGIENKESLAENLKLTTEIIQKSLPISERKTLEVKQESVSDLDLATKDILESSLNILEQENSLDMVAEVTKESFGEILEIFKTARFSALMSFLSVKEAVVISLKMGYVGDKYFSTKTISDILGVSEEEIRQITKKFLLICKEMINQAIDNTIEYTTDQKVLKRKKEEV